MVQSRLSILLCIAVIQFLFYLIAIYFRTDKVTDLAYGYTFVILAVWGYFQSTQTIAHGVIALSIILRGIRLGSYLFMRILKMGKDKRFDAMRNNWKSFGKFWILQTLSIWIIFLPASFFLQSTGDMHLGFLLVGAAIFLLGFSLETIADYQKYNYKLQHPKHRVSTGLWKHARHPNYLGEMLVWRGIFVMTIPLLTGMQWLSVISPLFIMILLLYISGIPLLEKQHDTSYGKNKDYITYKKSTSLLIPRPRKK